ncbi:unnamed protein product [Lathyrus sativus]|nr:unnamed protein product [Lathyrus sativus]
MGGSGYNYILRCPVTHGGMRIYEKLNCFFCNAVWRNMYPKAHVKTLHRMDISNYHLMLLTLMDIELR